MTKDDELHEIIELLWRRTERGEVAWVELRDRHGGTTGVRLDLPRVSVTISETTDAVRIAVYNDEGEIATSLHADVGDELYRVLTATLETAVRQVRKTDSSLAALRELLSGKKPVG